MRQKSPQEKKVLSYAKDRRSNYGENDKASRKNIPLRKAKVNRAYRRKVNEILSEVDGGTFEHADLVDGKAKNVKREFWKKCADEPLGTFLKRKLERRRSHSGNGKTARKKATEFLKTLKFKTEQQQDGRWIAEALGLNGVSRYGITQEDAIANCKLIARVVFMEKLGALEILSTKEGWISTNAK